MHMHFGQPHLVGDTTDQRLRGTARLVALFNAVLRHAYDLGIGDEAGDQPDPFQELRRAILARRAATELAEGCRYADVDPEVRDDILSALPCAADWLSYARTEALRARPGDPAAVALGTEMLAAIRQVQLALVALGGEPAPVELCGADGGWRQ